MVAFHIQAKMEFSCTFAADAQIEQGPWLGWKGDDNVGAKWKPRLNLNFDATR